MHIAFLTSEYPHPKVLHAAGIATSVKNLAVALVNKGEKVTVFVYHQNEASIIEDQGVTIHLIKKEKYTVLGWYFYRKHLQNYINKVVKAENIELLEAADWTGITAFTKFSVPLVIRFHGSDAYFCKLEKRKQKFKNFVFEKMALKSASAFIAPTTFAGAQTQKIFGLNNKKIKTILHGIQLRHFTNNTPDYFNKNSIVYIGTIIRKKGVLKLAEIFNKLIETNPHATLVLIGSDAPDIKTGHASTFKLMNSIFSEAAKQQVNYLGKIPYAQVQSEIKKAHVCVFPSFAETFGMVTIEAMAMQKPVVNTSIGWAQQLIDNGVNGYLVHPLNITLYAEKIKNLLNNKDLCTTIGRQARIKVENEFNIDKQADKNITYYKQIIAKG